MRRPGTTFMLLFAVGLLAASPRAYTQLRIPREKIPSDIPAELRAEIEKLYSSGTKERANAIVKLRYMGMKGKADRAVPFLLQMLGSADEFPRMTLLLSSLLPITESCSAECTFGGEAAETLARIGKGSNELLDLMKHRDWRVRANAMRALGGLDAGADDQLLAALAKRDEHPEVTGNAARALGLMKTRRAREPLIAVLKHDDTRVRGAAARALGLLSDPRAVLPLIAALDDDDAHVRIAVTSSLGRIGRIGEPAVLDPLLRALKDDHRQVRDAAAGALRCTRDPRVLEPLVAALADPYPNVRIGAAGTLANLGDPRAVEPLIALLGDDSQAVRGAAAAALGGLRDPRATQPLTSMVLKEGAFGTARIRGLAALAALGHAGAKEAREKYAGHRPGWDEWWDQHKEGLLRTE